MNINIVKDLLREIVAQNKVIIEKLDNVNPPKMTVEERMAKARAARKGINTGEGERV